MTSNDRTARLAGLLYLSLLPICGIALGGGQLTDPAAVLATPAVVEASRGFLEFRVVSGGAGFVVWIVLGVVLHRLFRPVGKLAADVLVALVAASSILALAALARQMDVLSLLDASRGLPALTGDQLQAQLTLALHGFRNMMLMSVLFWGLWLLPLGWLVFRSGFMPRVLGVLLMLGAPFYVLVFVGTALDAGYTQTPLATVVALVFGLPGVIGEIGTALWLLFRGTVCTATGTTIAETS